jgi:hypothetical protein
MGQEISQFDSRQMNETGDDVKGRATKVLWAQGETFCKQLRSLSTVWFGSYCWLMAAGRRLVVVGGEGFILILCSSVMAKEECI